MKCLVILAVFLLAMKAESKTTRTQSVYGKYVKKSDIFAKAQADCLSKLKKDIKDVRSSISVEVLAVLPEAKSYLALCELNQNEKSVIAKLRRKTQ